MCGIAGAIRGILDGREAAARPRSERIAGLVDKISQAQRHRGPDGSGLWESSGQEVIFGHRRLAILDLSDAGAQPMVDHDSGCAVAFNGEIYNFREIRRDLEGLGETFLSSCDTEVILKAFRRWGLDAVPRLRGIFALALWDPRARAVHLVRDPMGIKPLYWTAIHDGDTGEEVVLFASEVRALLASGAVPRRLEPAAVASYLWHGFVVGPHTIVEGVKLLPAASILTIRAGEATRGHNARQVRRYWQMPSSAARETTVEELRDELVKTVQMQLVADVPLGVFLSGGIDSSAVAVLASEVVPDAVHTFTIGFDEAAYDETPYAQQVADLVKSRHTRSVLTEQSFQAQLPDAFQAIDQPTFDGINTYFVSRAAREAGMTVALAGTGGDEVFGGYPSFVDIPRILGAGAWLRFADEAGLARRAFSGTVTLGARLASGMSWDVFKVAPPQTRWGKVADVARAAHDALDLYQVSYALFTRETQAALADGAVRQAQRQQRHGLPAHVAADWRQRIDGSDPRHAVSVLELSSFIGERLLRDTDAASMAVGLEVRVPLLDHVLAETAAGIDPGRRFSPPPEEAAPARRRSWPAPSGALRSSQVGFRPSHRHLVAPALAAADAGRVRRRRAGGQGWPPRRDGENAVALLHPRPARPVLVAHLGHLRAPLVVPDARRGPGGMMASAPHSGLSKVLFMSGLQIHPARSGGNLRSFALASALQRHGLEVFVYSMVGRKDDYLAGRPSGVQAWPGGIEEYVSRRPDWFVAQYGSYALALPPVWITAYLKAAVASPREFLLPAVLREKLAWCDVVVADFPFVHPIFSAPAARGRLRVLSTHNLEHQLCDGQSRWRASWLRAAVRAVELEAARACDILVSCCAGDRQFFEAEASVRQSVLVPNGIDRERFRGMETAREGTRQALGIGDDVKLFLFTASKFGPNAEAYDYLVGFARSHGPLLVEQGIHILVVGNVAAAPVRLPGLTATGKVDVVEAYFAAADAALNPMASGAGTNVKMCEFIATRLPIVSTPFGARGFDLEDGETAFLFERDGLGTVLSEVRRLFDEDPSRLRKMAEKAYVRNESALDMNACARPLVDAIGEARVRPPVDAAAVPRERRPSESAQEMGWLR